ncbi:MAG: hypothetical protein GY822_03040 [Deltaproteobacteria bacterium]|nr:hypothetical protein [Deltaproteobacteria bacterium]
MHTYTQKTTNEAGGQPFWVAKRWTWQDVEALLSEVASPIVDALLEENRDVPRRHWWPTPVVPNARRGEQLRPLNEFIDAALQEKKAGHHVGILLEHAGAHAFSWCQERVLSADEVAFISGERTPRRATPQDWQEIGNSFTEAAEATVNAGLALGICVDDDTLFHALLSPRLNPNMEREEREHIFFSLLKNLLSVDEELTLFLCIDDLCPDGIDPLMGRELALNAQKMGVKKWIFSTGSRGLALLQERNLQVPAGAKQKNDALLAPIGRLSTFIRGEVIAAGPFEMTQFPQTSDRTQVSSSTTDGFAGVMSWRRGE